MNRRFLAGLSCASALFISTAALAWGYDVSQSREIYRTTITVKAKDGKLGHAVLVFTVSAVTLVGEAGNAKWPDNRACYYNDIRRTFIRSLSYTAPDGTGIPLQDTTEVLPNLPGHSGGAVTTCNDVIGDINNTLVSATGDAQQWNAQIQGDTQAVDKILSQFGQVIGAKAETDVKMF
jgi:hypothetical protein